MNKLELSRDWLRKLLPQGLPYPSSTLISGPGGSGKPLVGLGFIYDWLKAGGNVVFVPLQYPKRNFLRTSLKRLYGLDISDYSDNVAYIQFDLDLDNWERNNKNEMRANLLKPEVWNEAIEELERLFSEGKPGNLVFASALNLLLFSPTYRKSSLTNIENLLSGEKERSYFFAVSTSAFREKVKRWENAADNLMFTRMEENRDLYLRTERLESKKIVSEEIKVPIEKEMLDDIKKVAEGVRERKIPKLGKI